MFKSIAGQKAQRDLAAVLWVQLQHVVDRAQNKTLLAYAGVLTMVKVLACIVQAQASGLLSRPLTYVGIVCYTKRNLIIGIDPHTTNVGLRQTNKLLSSLGAQNPI